jgi:hypothetical protein
VNGEDIIFAMTSLGFENYAEVLKIYLAKYRQVDGPLTVFTIRVTRRRRRGDQAREREVRVKTMTMSLRKRRRREISEYLLPNGTLGYLTFLTSGRIVRSAWITGRKE